MPTYEYKCEKCGYQFEKLQGINDEPIKICPKCGGTVKRLITGGNGLIFKGSGFYITDYKKSNTSSSTSSSRSRSSNKKTNNNNSKENK